MKKEMIPITLNGRELEVREDQMVLQVAREQGIDIPTLCYHEALGIHGGCRLCIVEAASPALRKGLMASCTLQVSPGLIVETNSPAVARARKVIFELLLGRAAESVPLREMAEKFGVTTSRFKTGSSEDCVRCGLCVRVCRERIGVAALCFTGRGQKKRVSAEFGQLSETCIGCGTCANLCPTGAIQLEDLGGWRRIFVGENTISRQPLVHCRQCGIPFQTAKFADYVRTKSDIEGASEIPRDLCSACARRISAEAAIGEYLA
ncbi:MAG: 2Fe-2S iron-sulfur cluster-binding protein [Rhodocyclaceae bacterium]|nr:2Fe-2S iron-sulfur cluster-binding protein [Rhodocyclaceae bacterium]